MSEVPPGGNGTTMRTCRAGYDCAQTTPAMMRAMLANRIRAIRIRIVFAPLFRQIIPSMLVEWT
jgi:hypothetical protein